MDLGGQHHDPAAFTSGQNTGVHCTWGWVSPRAGLDGCRKSRPHLDSIPGPSSPKPVAMPTTLTPSNSRWRFVAKSVASKNFHALRTVLHEGKYLKFYIPLSFSVSVK